MLSQPIDLTSQETIRGISTDFMLKNRINRTTSRPHMPSALELFDLATDTLVSTETHHSPSMRGLRLKCAREMAGQSSASLRAVLGGEVKTTTAAEQTIGHYEKNKRQPDQKRVMRLSRIYKVDQVWVETGATTSCGLPCYPEWLEPWVDAVAAARDALVEYLGSMPQFMLSDDPQTVWEILKTVPNRRQLGQLDPGYDPEMEQRFLNTSRGSMAAVLRACIKARKDANLWTKIALRR